MSACDGSRPNVTTDSKAFLEARDFLLGHRDDYDAACRGFAWPRFDEFNWALDYFDALAAGNDSRALWIVEEDGRQQQFTFAELSATSNRVANWLHDLGVRRRDRVL